MGRHRRAVNRRSIIYIALYIIYFIYIIIHIMHIGRHTLRAVIHIHIIHIFHLLNSRISPGWQSSTSQIASRVEKRIAFALPVYKMERFAGVIPIFAANSPEDIFRLASITSRLTIICIVPSYIVKSFSALI